MDSQPGPSPRRGVPDGRADVGGTTAPVEPPYCGHCGEPLAADHASCTARLRLEPPRYCPWCRRRMKVQVTPRGWTADCVVHPRLSG